MTSQTLLLLVAVLVVTVAFLLCRTLQGGRPSPGEGAEIERLRDRVRRIAESEERYRSLVEATTELIVQRDSLGRITFANAGFGCLVGTDAFALVGSTVEVPCLEHGPMAEGPDGVRRIERRLAPVNGPPRWFSFIEMPVVGSDGQTQWLHAGSDITGRIEAARSLDEALSRAEAANVAKSRFLATVSHEFRTPLNGILGMADLVLDTGLDAEQRTYVEAVRTSGKALLSLIDGILDFSRIESGRLDLAAAPFDLAALAEGVVELLAPRAQDKGIEIALDLGEDFAGAVIGDADRVRQILVNLAGNAVKFTQTGGVGIEIARTEDGVALTVRDTGPGIPPERIPHLFEEFEQGDGSASRRHEGTGLGLAITRRLVARMGGRIETESLVGQGSRFTAILPLAEDASAPPPEPVSLNGRRVLIVAQSPFQAPYLARRLVRAGARAEVVSIEAGALAALATQPFDAVIADRSLGDSTVRTLARAAKGHGVRCSLVLLSPFDRREFGAPGAAGFDGYLIKPVRARSLLDRLKAPASSPSAAAEPAVDAPSEPAPRSGARVLLAEDNPINALLATKALERLGATVVPARDGLEAVALFEDGRFDLALVDIRMPGLDGLETARRIRALEAARGARRLHLVALTANAGREDERAAQAAGFDDFLPKPLNLRALPALLDRRSDAA
ncbi:ATP-binding protein [Methylobacterium gossipiicola]|uniref:Sensory/regulatory protein RpfC n=1 Tax=Methylobacterium gossipiicola TaxID=582675 RepID=A0A1I2T0K0_9HYPH|nr:ATP-binding protein [Methylobacterium gossipiicola]SFG58423.1 PAS domain S-box-containing protein [Methylobacterium gossipiicola]